MSQRLVVTGSEGFVGKHLRRALALRGVEVLGIDRPGTGAEIELDLASELDAGLLATRVGPVTGVIYMAATITRGSSIDALARRNLTVIAEAAVRLFEAFHHSSPEGRFVYCSTYKGYGPSPETLIDPERPPQRPDPHSYGSAKVLAERLLAIAAARIGATYAAVRPTCIYGPGQHRENAIPRFLAALWSGERPVVFGTGRDVRDDVLVSDLSYCLAEACLRKATGAFHASGERARTIWEVAEECSKAVESLGGPRGLSPVLDRSRPAKWWLDQRFDLERTRRLLGYQPTPLAIGLRREAEWLRDGGDPARSLDFGSSPEPS